MARHTRGEALRPTLDLLAVPRPRGGLTQMPTASATAGYPYSTVSGGAQVRVLDAHDGHCVWLIGPARNLGRSTEWSRASSTVRARGTASPGMCAYHRRSGGGGQWRG